MSACFCLRFQDTAKLLLGSLSLFEIPFIHPTHNGLSQTCWFTAKSSVSMHENILVCFSLCLLPMCLPVFTEYVTTHIKSLLICMHKYYFLTFVFSCLLSHTLCAAESRVGESFKARQNLQGETAWKGGRQRQDLNDEKSWQKSWTSYCGWGGGRVWCNVLSLGDGWNIGGTKEYEVFMGGAGTGKMMEPTHNLL